ncbi:MAG: hypothetical protein QW041_02160 [Candidatus Pacearchaeota archaeon]
MDLFENIVLCKDCGKKMKPDFVEKEGFKIRALKCPSCSNKILHPSDLNEYNKFNSLKNRQFHVKLRLVGNSYTVSIPREIVNFIKNDETENIHQKMQEHVKKQMRAMEKMVTLAMEEANKIALSFNTPNNIINENSMHEQKKAKTFKIIKLRRQNYD